MGRKKKKTQPSMAAIQREAAFMFASAKANKAPSRKKREVFQKTLREAETGKIDIPDIYIRRCQRS